MTDDAAREVENAARSGQTRRMDKRAGEDQPAARWNRGARVLLEAPETRALFNCWIDNAFIHGA